MHRILLFEGHWYAIYSYGFMLVMAMLAGMWVTAWRAPSFGVTAEQATDLVLALLVGGVVGARVVEVIEDWPAYSDHVMQIFNIRAGGFWWHGGVAGGLIAFLWFAGRTGIPRGALFDLATPGMVLGHVLGRVGCFLNGCCYGKPTSLPWAVTFPDAPELHHIPRHPTELYEAFWELAVFGFLLRWKPRGFKTGALFYAWCCLYAPERFLIDFLRTDPVLAGGLTFAQYASMALMAIGTVGLWRARMPVASASLELAARPATAKGA